MAQQHISIGTVPNAGTDGDTARSAWGKAEANFTELYAAFDPGYISGLKMTWNSATSISVSSGAAWIPGDSQIVQNGAALTLSSLVLTASTWHHVYLYLNAGTPAIECVPTAPAAPYNGTARTKTGDTSRRYVGSVKTDTGGGIIQFLHSGNQVKILTDLGISVLGVGTATTDTPVSCATACPITALSALMSIDNAPAAGASVFVGIPAVPRLAAFYSGTVSVFEGAIDSSQNISYRYASAPTSSGCGIRIIGYTFGR